MLAACRGRCCDDYHHIIMGKGVAAATCTQKKCYQPTSSASKVQKSHIGLRSPVYGSCLATLAASILLGAGFFARSWFSNRDFASKPPAPPVSIYPSVLKAKAFLPLDS